jgi:DnaJ-class molecular chaperone
LSDSAKRENYDSYGVDENNAGGGDRARVNPFGGFQRGRGGAHEISPDELFNMFFQGAGGGQGFRAQFGGRAGGRQQPQQQPRGEGQQGGLLQQLMQFLPIIMLVLMSFSSLGGNQQQQVRVRVRN